MNDPTNTAKDLTLSTVGNDNNDWGTPLNEIFSVLDTALGGTVSLPISDSTSLNTSGQARNSGYEFCNDHMAGLLRPHRSIQRYEWWICDQLCASGGTYVTVQSGETVALGSDRTSPQSRLRSFGTTGNGTADDTTAC